MKDIPILNKDKRLSLEELNQAKQSAESLTSLRNEKDHISSFQYNLLSVMNLTGLPLKFFIINLFAYFRPNEDRNDRNQFTIERLIHRFVERFDISGVEKALSDWQQGIVQRIQAKPSPIYPEMIIQPLQLVEQRWSEILRYAKSLKLSSLDEGLIDRVRERLKESEQKSWEIPSEEKKDKTSLIKHGRPAKKKTPEQLLQKIEDIPKNGWMVCKKQPFRVLCRYFLSRKSSSKNCISPQMYNKKFRSGQMAGKALRWPAVNTSLKNYIAISDEFLKKLRERFEKDPQPQLQVFCKKLCESVQKRKDFIKIYKELNRKPK